MVDEEVAVRVHDLLAGMAGDLTFSEDPDDDDGLAPLKNPVLTEWVLLANVADLDTGIQRVVVLHAPHMLYSHVIGLIAMAPS